MLMKDGSVRNAYTLRLRNMQARPRDLEVALVGLPQGAVMWTENVAATKAAPQQIVTVPANETRIVRAYVTIPAGTAATSFSFRLTSLAEDGEIDLAATNFTTPGGE